MFRTIRRPASVLLLLALMPSLTGCMTTRQTTFNSGTVGLDRITGVTMRSGQEIRFREPGASVANDSMYALGPGGRIVLPSDSIALVWQRKTSTGRSIGLVAGVAFVGATLVSIIAFGEHFQPLGGNH
jgi:hypothetical protein